MNHRRGEIPCDRRFVMSYRIAVVLAILLSCCIPSTAYYYYWELVAPGIAHIHQMTAEPWDIHILIVDLSEPGVRLRSVVKNDTMLKDAGEVVSSMAIRHDALAAVNTDFFYIGIGRHEPLGWTMTDGKLQLVPYLSGPIVEDRPALVITKKNRARIGTYQATQSDWWNVASGNLELIVNGVLVVPPSEVRHPRTAVGITPEADRLILITVDGRQACSIGMSSFEEAMLLWKLGAWNAMNFDGGGSTTMWIDGRVVNHPSDGRERRVAGALVILAPARNFPQTTKSQASGKR